MGQNIKTHFLSLKSLINYAGKGLEMSHYFKKITQNVFTFMPALISYEWVSILI